MDIKFEKWNDYFASLEQGIASVMENQVAENAKVAIQVAEEGSVYSAYVPYFLSRRKDKGGIQDKGNMQVNYAPRDHELTIKITATWQHLYGGKYPDNDLADVIEKNGMYHAPARPFMNTAETLYSRTEFETDLVYGLKKLGY